MLLLTGVVATGSVALLLWALLNGRFPELQRQLILRGLNRSAEFEIELAAAHGSLVEGFTLEEVVIRPAGPTGAVHPGDSDSAVAVDRVHLTLDLSQLFEQRLIIIQSLVIDGVSLRVEQTDELHWRIVGMPSPSPAKAMAGVEPLRIEARQVEVRNAEIVARWHDPFGPGRLTIKGGASTHDFIWPNEREQLLPANFAASVQLTDGDLGFLQLYSGRVKLNATPGRLQLNLERASLGSTELGQFQLSGSASLELDGDAISLSKVDAQLGFTQLDLREIGSHLIAAANFPSTRLNGDLRIDVLKARTQPDRAPAQKALDLRFRLSLDPSRVRDLAIDSARAELNYQTESNRWSLSDVELAIRSSRFEGNAAGTLRTLEHLNLNALDLPIEDIADALGYEWNGTGSVDLGARLSGPIDDPLGQIYLEGAIADGEHSPLDFSVDVDLLGDGQYLLERITVAAAEPSDILFRSRSPSEISFENDTWTLTNLDLDGLAGDLTIVEARTNGREHRLKLELDSLDIHPLSRYASAENSLTGTLSGPLEIVRMAERTRLDCDLLWRHPGYANFSADQIELNVQSSEDSLQIEIEIDSGGPRPAHVSARLPNDELNWGPTALASHRDFRFAVSLHELPASRLTSFFADGKDRSELFAGTISGEFRAEGSNTGLLVEADATWADARFGTAVADNVQLQGRSEAGALLLELGISHEGHRGFLGTASIDLEDLLEQPELMLRDADNHATLRADRIDLGWLVPRASARRLGRIEEVRGFATGHLSVKGSATGPQLTGDLRIEEAQLQLALVDERIGPIHGHLVFSNDGVQVERIEIESKKGSAIVTGRYRLGRDGQDDLRLNARFEKFALTHFPLLEARINGSLDLTGSLGALDAKGDLDFGHVQINLPAPEDPLFREVRILGLEKDDAQAAETLDASQPSAYQTMQAEISIVMRSGARIRQRGADLRAKGQFLLRKKRMGPTLLQGGLQTTGGTYTFLGRRFDVSEAVATFNGRNPPDPDLHLVAVRQFGDVTVGVERTGRWSEPESRLISTPQMDDPEILSYLMFGKPIDEVGQDDDNRLNAAAAQVAGNLALSQLARALSEGLPINEISMDVNEDMTVATLGVETSVGEDIIVRYDRALQAGAGDRVTVEWRFYKNLSLRSEYANGDTSGLDVFWSYEY